MGSVTRRLSRDARRSARAAREKVGLHRLAWLSVFTVLAVVAAMMPINNAYAVTGTTTTITNASALTTASVVGQPYAVNFNIAWSGGFGDPTGTVTVSDGSATCNTTALSGAAGSNVTGTCNLASATVGAKSITASYAGNGTGTFNFS